MSHAGVSTEMPGDSPGTVVILQHQGGARGFKTACREWDEAFRRDRWDASGSRGAG